MTASPITLELNDKWTAAQNAAREGLSLEIYLDDSVFFAAFHILGLDVHKKAEHRMESLYVEQAKRIYKYDALREPRWLLEALLLSGMELEKISEIFEGLSFYRQTVKVYHELFFNCQPQLGHSCRAEAFILKQAQEEGPAIENFLWKAYAITYGPEEFLDFFSALSYGIEPSPEIQRRIEAITSWKMRQEVSRLVLEGKSDKDSLKVVDTYSKMLFGQLQEKTRQDRLNKPKDEADELVMELIDGLAELDEDLHQIEFDNIKNEDS